MAKQRTDAQLCLTMQRHPNHRREAWRILIERHAGLIAKLSHKYLIRETPSEDMYAEALRGMRYSCMSYNPKKAKFTTHMGWGIMKYCLAYRDRVLRDTQNQKLVSQSDDISSRYFETPNRICQRKKLSRKGFQKIIAIAQHCKCNQHDIEMLRLAIMKIGREERKAIRKRLFKHWYELRLNKVCKQMMLYHEGIKKSARQ